MWCGVNPLSLWILCYWCVLGTTDTVNDNKEADIKNIPLRQKRTTDGGRLPPLPMTQHSGSVPSGRSGQASYDYQHGGASFDTSDSHQTASRRDQVDDEIRTRMVFNTANYDVHAELGESTYTPNTHASTGHTATTRDQGTQTGDDSRTTVTQYYVTREGTAQRIGTNEELGTGNEEVDSTQYNSEVQVQYPYNSRTPTRGQSSRTQTSHSQTAQTHGQTTQGRRDHGQTTQGRRGHGQTMQGRRGHGQTTQGETSYNYNSRIRTNPGQSQNPVYNTGTQPTRVRSNTPVYQESESGTQTSPYQTQHPTRTGTSYSTETRTTQTQTYRPYQTGTTYTTGARQGGGYGTLGQVFNLNTNNNRQYTTSNSRRYPNRGGYVSGTSAVPNTGVISDDPNCPTSTYRVYINNMECTRAVDTLGSFICYNYERVSRDCCEKCLSIKRSNSRGCEYGDRSYQCRNMEPFDCYAQRNREICCDTCSRYESQRNTGISGCEYGDLTPRCQIVSERRHLCYLPENQRLCCLTCPRLEDTSNPTCKWGDQNPQLCEPFTQDNQLRVNCYQTSVRQVCCSTCERLRARILVNIPGCQFGDRPVRMNTPLGMLSCREYVRQYGVEVCETEAINTHCCHTCYQYRALSRG
ncbi:uncharacterized protein LOC110463887 [Mizuhopecten yessoensis]|uniref:Uncharacterized protein n=1 Tax=Mizuhopecten yessoensis TaxID=6573 RepID=A0A210PV70_MIZYE|nr:uncharacterized protein LOC110463887 [Mizuhopecten yessoensis]OWF40390.1 hypothetical protein KP79_PYT18069 [Mizuhopecten yessoensis]